jgi:hypothetical protein
MNCEVCGLKNCKEYLVKSSIGIERHLLCNSCAYHIESRRN